MKENLRLRTRRLCLVPATAAIGRAELGDRARFAALLGARVPHDWPTPLNDEGSITFFTEYLEANPNAVGWAAWYFLLRESDDRLTAVGNGGFKGAPDQSGTVEIGYSVLEEYQCRGIAPECVEAMVAWAFSHEAVSRVIAHTLPGLMPSIRVLEKCGFSFAGEGLEEGAIMYQRVRERIEA